MMRVITPKGKLREISLVSPVVEMRNRFNGKVSRTVAFAESMEVNPTAIQLDYAGGPIMGDRTLFVGNLKTETVRDIMHNLLEQGYFDFTSLDYQYKTSVDLERTVFDNGKSKPYTSEFTHDTGCVLGGMGMNSMSPFNSMPGNAFGGFGQAPIECGDNTEYWRDEGEACDDQE